MNTKINKLDEIDKTKHPFKVPENYFAQFNAEIMDRLPEKEIVIPEPISLWDKVKPWVYMAAMFIGFYFTINMLMKTPASNEAANDQITSQQTLSLSSSDSKNYWTNIQITEEEFYEYLEEQLIDDSYFDYMDYHYNLN